MANIENATLNEWRRVLRPFSDRNGSLAFLDFVFAASSFLSPMLLIMMLPPHIGNLVAVRLTVSILVGLSLVKLFTIQHDCGHQNYFNNKALNSHIGRLCSLFTLMPYSAWRTEHAEHHTVFGNVDEPRFGDLLLIRKSRYIELGYLGKIAYRTFRSPVFLFAFAPLLYVVFRQRIPSTLSRVQIQSCVTHFIAAAAVYSAFYWVFGSVELMIYHLGALYFAALCGVLIFLIEHQFPDSQWRGNEDWSFLEASVGASSYFRLPPILEWYTGAIGYHHIHHLLPSIPSYRLAAAFEGTKKEIPGKQVGFGDLLQSFRLGVFDDDSQRLIPIPS